MYNSKMIALGQTRSVIRELFEYGNKLAQKIGRENVFDFTLGNPSVPTPKEVDDCLIARVKNDSSIHGYTSAQGAPYVRARIAEHLSKTYNLPIDKEHIYMTCGAAASLTISLCAGISDDQDEVVIITPYFPEYVVFAQNAGAKVVIVPADEKDYQIDFSALENAITSRTYAVIINSPNNPSGVVYTAETLDKVANVLKQAEKKFDHTILLISDEPYREIVFDQDFVSPLSCYDDCVMCYSYSKAFSLAGERIGYIALPNTLKDVDRFYEAVLGAGRSLGFVCAPSLMQQVVADCIDVPSNIAQYRENRDLLVEALTNLGFEVVIPQGAFYLIAKVPNGDAEAFSNFAKEYGILVVPTTTFGLDGYVRIATCVSKDLILRSLPVFERLAKDYFASIK